MKVLGSKAVIAAYIPAFSNQAIHFTGDDMGGDKTMVMTLLYILIAIMAFVFAVTTNNTITKKRQSSERCVHPAIPEENCCGIICIFRYW